MVTKRVGVTGEKEFSYILAKNHMVTKLNRLNSRVCDSYILAKNHMVTKLVPTAV